MSKFFASPIEATSALAVIGPVPGTWASLQLRSLLRRQAWIFTSLFDLVIHGLEMIKQALHQQPKRAGQVVGAVFDQLGNADSDVADTLRNDCAKLAE